MKFKLPFIPQFVSQLRDAGNYVLKSAYDTFANDIAARVVALEAARVAHQATLATKISQSDGDARYGQLGAANVWTAQQKFYRASGSVPLWLGQLPSSTGIVRDAALIDTIWTDATDATRTSILSVSTVNSGGALTEGLRVYKGIADTPEFKIGGRPAIRFDGLMRFDDQGFGARFGHHVTIGGDLLFTGGTHNIAVPGKVSSAVGTNIKGGYGGIFACRANGYTTDTATIRGNFDKTLWYQGQGLTFAVSAGADISGGTSIFDAVNISSGGDLRVLRAENGLVLTDRTTAAKYRCFVNNGVLAIEATA